MSRLDSPGVAPEVISLSKKQKSNIILKTYVSEEANHLGNQYLMLILPFGQIKHTSVQQALEQRLFTGLVLNGLSPITYIGKNQVNVANNYLKVSLKNAQLTAYDLFFTRKVVCKLSFDVEFKGKFNRLPIEYEISHKKSEFKAMPFKPYLESLFNKTLNEAVDEILKTVNDQY